MLASWPGKWFGRVHGAGYFNLGWGAVDANQSTGANPCRPSLKPTGRTPRTCRSRSQYGNVSPVPLVTPCSVVGRRFRAASEDGDADVGCGRCAHARPFRRAGLSGLRCRVGRCLAGWARPLRTTAGPPRSPRRRPCERALWFDGVGGTRRIRSRPAEGGAGASSRGSGAAARGAHEAPRCLGLVGNPPRTRATRPHLIRKPPAGRLFRPEVAVRAPQRRRTTPVQRRASDRSWPTRSAH